MQNITFSQATTEDLDEIVQLAKKADPQYAVKSVHQWTKEDQVMFPNLQFVAKYDEKIVGMISASGEVKYLTIDDLSVEPTFQNQHIGSKLVALVENEAKQMGFTISRLWVHPSNKKVIAFYQSLAYRLLDKFKGKNIEGIPDGEQF